jgi:hypothetical protein
LNVKGRSENEDKNIIREKQPIVRNIQAISFQAKVIFELYHLTMQGWCITNIILYCCNYPFLVIQKGGIMHICQNKGSGLILILRSFTHQWDGQCNETCDHPGQIPVPSSTMKQCLNFNSGKVRSALRNVGLPEGRAQADFAVGPACDGTTAPGNWPPTNHAILTISMPPATCPDILQATITA